MKFARSTEHTAGAFYFTLTFPLVVYCTNVLLLISCFMCSIPTDSEARPVVLREYELRLMQRRDKLGELKMIVDLTNGAKDKELHVISTFIPFFVMKCL
jgi:hypothetical protein